MPIEETIEPLEDKDPVENATSTESVDTTTSAEALAESEDALFGEYETVLKESGIDTEALKKHYDDGNKFEDSHIEALAKATGYKKDDVAKHLALMEQVRDSKSIVTEYHTKQAEAELAEYNEAAGGDYTELKKYIGTAMGQDEKLADKVSVWNLMLASTKEHRKLALAEMNAYRSSLGNQAPKTADLNVLTRSSASATPKKPEAPKPVEVNPLENNPYSKASLQHLSEVKLAGPKHPGYEHAMAALSVRAPHLV